MELNEINPSLLSVYYQCFRALYASSLYFVFSLFFSFSSSANDLIIIVLYRIL